MMGLRDFASRTLYGGGASPERRASIADMLALRDVRHGTTPLPVSYDGAQAHAAVYACVDLLVRLVVWQMPAEVYRTSADPERADAHLPPPRIIANPHPFPHMTNRHWRASVLESALQRGFTAGIVTAVDGSGWPQQIMPAHPDDVTWDDGKGAMDWRYRGQPVRLWQEGGELWVAPGLRVAPGSPVGLSALAAGAQQIGLGLGASRFGKGFFDNSSSPSGIVSVNVPQLTDEQSEKIKRRFVSAAGNREPVVLSQIADYKPIHIAPNESQFLDTIKANVAMVCMFFGVPPEAIGGSSGDSMTYANVEGRNLSLLTNTVGAWMQWMEQTLSSLLPRPQRVELDPEALLRTSVPTLYETATKAIGSWREPGLLTINEARAMVGYGPLPGGEQLYMPVQPSANTNGGGQQNA